MAFSKGYLLDWQRRMDPARYNKATGAKFHTAPSIVMPGAPDYPADAPDGTVTMMFLIDGENWLRGREDSSIRVESPVFVEKEPKTKRAKHGPVIIMGASEVYGAMTTKENYYWSAQVLSQHRCALATFKPGKANKNGGYKVVAVVTFFPNEDELPGAE